MKQKTAIVTGASSGIGLATAILFAKNGYKTYGFSRRQQGRTDFIEIKADVNEDESIKAAVAQVLKEQGRIDVLINNAGFAMVGATEESSIGQIKSMFETNFFGAVRMSNAVLPTMRGQGAGRILHIGSIVGLIPAPYMSYYGASKHALEGYSESLDHEVRRFGIRSIIVEPGFMKTSINSHAPKIDGSIFEYASRRESYQKLIEQGVDNASSPELVAEKVLEAAELSHPKLRYPVGKDAILISFLRRFAPRAFFDRTLRSQFKID